MNRGGGFQSFLVQQMTMGGNPSSWWASNMNSNSVRAAAALVDQEEAANSLLPSSSPSPSSVFPHHQFQSLQPSSHLLPTNQDLPESWSQLLLQGGLGGGEEYSCRYGSNNPFQAKDHEMEMYQAGSEHMGSSTVKQEISSENAYAYSKPQWSQMLQASSPRSCVTSTASFNSNMLDFSNNKPPELGQGHHQQPENSSECNSTTSGSAFKKARVQGSSPLQSTFKVRKEKLGDRITALHQIVSPFGKTDTASVLLEAIGYIRFLLSQIEALSSPYLASGSGTLGTLDKEREIVYFQKTLVSCYKIIQRKKESHLNRVLTMRQRTRT
uniref:BHLH domain-containing protein n=1 Tax=Ananas comosus var. bracteatus TaxID=296719 RepID=A0A6V7NVF3_ANACO|nr:unnamed protein product [Ananas comosus var. bracteatus]